MIRPVALLGRHAWLRHDREEVEGVPVGGHDGVAAVDELRAPTDAEGRPLGHLLELACPDPDCRWSSTHPVGGGGLPEDDARRLQRIFALRLEAEGLAPDEAVAAVRALVAATDGPHRDLLGPPATDEDNGESSMEPSPAPPPVDAPPPPDDPTLVEADLGDAIIREIDRTLATPFASRISPTLAELLDYLDASRRALDHRTAALRRIRETLDAARQIRDRDVPVT